MYDKRFDKWNEVAVRLCEWYARPTEKRNEEKEEEISEKSNIDIRSTKFSPTKHDF